MILKNLPQCPYLELLGQLISDQYSETGEEGCQEHTDISDLYGDVQEPSNVVKNSRGHHKSWKEEEKHMTGKNQA